MEEASNIVSLQNRRHPRRQGFTLVEVMMAATILLIGFGAMIQAMVIGSETLAHAKRQTLAAHILTHELEKLRVEDWSTISALPGGPTTIVDSASSTWPTDWTYTNTDSSTSSIPEAITASGASFLVTRSATTVDTNLREVTFTLTWTVRSSGSNAARTYTRINTSYFGKYGLNLTYQ